MFIANHFVFHHFEYVVTENKNIKILEKEVNAAKQKN